MNYFIWYNRWRPFYHLPYDITLFERWYEIMWPIQKIRLFSRLMANLVTRLSLIPPTSLACATVAFTRPSSFKFQWRIYSVNRNVLKKTSFRVILHALKGVTKFLCSEWYFSRLLLPSSCHVVLKADSADKLLVSQSRASITQISCLTEWRIYCNFNHSNKGFSQWILNGEVDES